MKIRDIFGLEITKKNEKNWKEIEEEIKEKEYRNSEEYKIFMRWRILEFFWMELEK